MDTANLEDYPDRLAETFKNRTILITGGSGFVGKVFIEKLLRSCTDLKKIYIIMRQKRDKNPTERIRDIFNGPLFDMLKKQQGDEVLKKVEIVTGDMSEPDLGLSPDDLKKLTEEVEMIYHCAATIRFDEPLKKTVLLNVRGTKLMLQLAKQCKNLIIFAYLSTAYCHLEERILYEKTYPPPADPHAVIKACEWMDEDILKNITKKILGDIPNTYAYSKALGEGLVNEQMGHLPVIILRPSVIIPVWKEPLPGWTDNINGPMGLLIAAGKGVLRTMYCNSDTYADYVPVDIVANCLIASSFIHLQTGQCIFNVTSSAEYKVTFEEIISIGRNIVRTKLPLNWAMWYPGGSLKRFRIHHYFEFVLFQLIPALVIDAVLIFLRIKPILMKVQKRIYKGYEVFEYYTNRQWDFNNVDSLKIRDILNPREKATYKLDGDGVDYYDYFTDCIHSARRYILKETDDTIPMAKMHMQIMWFLDRAVKSFLVIGFLYILYKYLTGPVLQIFS